MRFSAKARYGLAATVYMAKYCGSDSGVTVISLATRLDISKIYLEQVFSMLKRGGIVLSVKGSKGGYFFARPEKDISVYDVLSSIETSLFEKTESTITQDNLGIEKAMQETVFDGLDCAVKEFLMNISIADVAQKTNSFQDLQYYMYYL